MALGNDYVDQDTIMKNDNNNNRALPETGNIDDTQNVNPKVIQQPNVQNEKINGKINQQQKNIKNKWKPGGGGDGNGNIKKFLLLFNGKLLKDYYFFLFPKFEDSIILIFLFILVLVFIIKRKKI